MKQTYKNTMYACFIGYIVQAIVNNFVPLLFLTFQSSYGIPITKITFLVTFNFGLQLVIDLLSAGFIDKIGYRISVVAAHIFAAAGLVLLVVLPELFADPFTGLLLAVMVYALGGGLIEVLISPIVESCPSDNKETAMSLLHSFYCWGHVAVVLLSTVFFAVFGISSWKVMALIWAVIPLLNAVFFTRVPLVDPTAEDGHDHSIKGLLSNRIFWIMILLMICAGASEHSVGQWASTFAERGLGIDKMLGDLAGPMFFAIMMGVSRVWYSKVGEKIDLQIVILFSGMLCAVSYLMISLSPWPLVSLLGCGLCGFSVGIFWPGTISMSAGQINSGTAMFAILALAGDLGCSVGPTLVGRVAGMAGDDLKAGILAALIFPTLLVLGILINMVVMKREAK